MNQILTQTAINKNDLLDNYDKGRDFEDYIRRLFNENSFRLKKWRQAQKDIMYSLDHSCPDLELVFAGRRKYLFAVECKWRKEFRNGKIDWANDYQICSYMNFQNQKRIPVFVAIGIGGEPSYPEKLFVTPLDNICNYTDVYESQLIPFKRKPTQRFFYDTIQLRLF
jgi:hypothetical protein